MKSPGEAIKGAGKAIAKTAKFFTTFIGQIVFFLLFILLIGLLAYIVFMVIAKDLAKLVGIDAAAAQTQKSDYDIQIRLANSGYSSVLNADELVEYYGFEYAVLMDAVRFIEETGVSEIPIVNISPVDCNTIDREQWAWLNAARFQTSNDNQALMNAKFLNADGTRVDGGPMATIVGGDATDDLASAGAEIVITGGNSEEGGSATGFEAAFDITQFSKPGEGKIVYEGVKNEYTGETVLTPYLKVTRKWLDYGYYLEDKSWAGGESDLNVSGKGKMDRYNLDGGYSEDGADLNSGFAYIYENIFALYIKNELNENNKSAYPKGRYTASYIQEAMQGATANDDSTGTNGNDGSTSRYASETAQIAAQNSSQNNTVGAGQVSTAAQVTGNGQNATSKGGEELDLYKQYADSLYYTVGDQGTRNYKIPFRVLLDRFLPNANLMASWRHLSDETETSASIDIVKEIQQIYSKACLEGETGGPEPADMTNNATFAVMGIAKVESNLFRHWKAIKEERYVYADAFEGVAFGETGDEIKGSVTFSWEENTVVEVTKYYKVLDNNVRREISEEEYEAELPLYKRNEHTGYVRLQTITREEVITEKKEQEFSLDSVLKNRDNVLVRSIPYAEAVTHLFWNYLPQEAQEEGMGNWAYTETVLIPFPSEEKGSYFTEDTTGKRLVKTAPGEEYTDRMGEILLAGEMAVLRENEGTTEEREYDTALPATAEPGVDGSETIQTEFNIITLKDMAFSSTHDSVNLNEGRLQWVISENAKASNFAKGKDNFQVESVTVETPKFYAVFPVNKKEIAYTQSVWAKSLPFYLTTAAKTWSAEKQFNHRIIEAGTFDDPENYHFIIQCNNYAKGYMDYRCTLKANWRCQLFAPVFAGDADEAKTKARESDVLVLLSEWEEAADEGIGAADYFIRDLRALLQYSKGVTDSRDGGTTEAIQGPDGPYIHPGSYAYLYIKDEILEFDEALAEPIFWTNRLFATPGDDAIDESTENQMKSRMVTKTWQNVDYALYDECKNDNGSYSVYALWPFGSQYSGLLYAMAANASEKENLKIFREEASGWGGFGMAHQANDLYGRRLSAEICETAFLGGTTALIQAEYSNGKVTLTGTDSTGGLGLYFDDVPVTLTLDGTNYHFNGTQAAVYGYALYTRTAQIKDPKKAEAEIRQELEEEVHWTKIKAIAPGIVISSGANTSAGFFVKILHADGTTSNYCHMKRYPEVQIGDYVGAGTLLGYEGTTGRSSGFHLHNAVVINSGVVNPTRCYYPFFTPFFYEEKADEAGRALSSEYMSYERTIFPYQQLAWDHSGLWEKGGKNVEIENDKVVIQNYTPTISLLSDVAYLLTKESDQYVDYSKLPTKNVSTDLAGEEFDQILETSPSYFDEDYIKAVVGRASGDAMPRPSDLKSGDGEGNSE